jgi:hypothetical protein
MNINVMLRLAAFACVAGLVGCAASPTERAFGDAVRHTMAQQVIPPDPAPTEEVGTDGQRLEGVMSVYRTLVGEPRLVVGESPAE